MSSFSLLVVPKNAVMKLLGIHPSRGDPSLQYKQTDVHAMCSGNLGSMNPTEILKFILINLFFFSAATSQ